MKEIMKRIFLFVLFLTIAGVSVYAQDSNPVVELNDTNFPDDDFRNLAASYDYDGDGWLSEEEIAKLNKKINDYLDNKAPDLLQGRLNYERIKADEIKTLNNSNWKRKDEQMFIDYYTAIDYRTVNRLKKTKRKESLTTHKLFFLLLLEMGKSEKYIANLFGISERSIDTLKTRTKPIE